LTGGWGNIQNDKQHYNEKDDNLSNSESFYQDESNHAGQYIDHQSRQVSDFTSPFHKVEELNKNGPLQNIHSGFKLDSTPL
jgi:hypothetical protein